MLTLRTLTASLSLLPITANAVLNVTIDAMPATCSYPTGSVTALPNGGTPPYSFLWGGGETTQGLNGLLPGTYSVTVTDALSDQATAQVDLVSQPYLFEAIINGMPWCGSPRNAFEDPLVSGMANTWTVNGWPTELSGGGFIQFPTDAGTYTYTVDDGNGCTGTVSGYSGPQITDWPALTINDVDPSCDNEPIGAIDVHAAAQPPGGGFGPYVHLFRLDGVPVYQAEMPDGNLDVHFMDLAPGVYGVHWWLGTSGENLDPGTCTYDTVWVTVPSLGTNCGSVQGTSYIDLDGDCVMDPNEAGIPYSPLLVQPGNEAVLTDGFGQFAFGLPNGSYTLEQLDPTLVPICPGTQPVPFSVNSDVTAMDLANGSTEPLDLRASLGGTNFRPGFDTQLHLYALNASPQLSGAVTVTLELDPLLTYISSQLPPVVNGSTLTWSFSAFTSYQFESWMVTVNVPVGTPLGTQLSNTLTVSNTLPDAIAWNDSDTDTDIVVGSYDPNDKRALTSTRTSGSLYYIDLDDWVDYTIRFQNTGTFPAEFVVITDTIAPELDMLSFEQGVASHPFTVSFKPGRVIEWRFDNIQLPDSSSDEPGSHGLVKFRLKPQTPLVPGTIIANIANIYFDFNEPVITEPSVLVAEFSTGQGEVTMVDGLTVYPNPAHDRLELVLEGIEGPVQVVVHAMDGRAVAAGTAVGQRHALAIGHLAVGAYALRATGADGRIHRAHFIKD